MHPCNVCTGWDIYDHHKASRYYLLLLLHGFPNIQYLTSSMTSNKKINNILCHISHHLSGYHIVRSEWKWKSNLFIGPKHNAMHIYIPLDWTNQSARLFMKVQGKIEFVWMILSNTQYLNYCKKFIIGYLHQGANAFLVSGDNKKHYGGQWEIYEAI